MPAADSCRRGSGGELVHVRRPGLLGGVAGAGQDRGELCGELADVDGELAAFLGHGLVGAERAMNLPVEGVPVAQQAILQLVVGAAELVVGVVESENEQAIGVEQR